MKTQTFLIINFILLWFVVGYATEMIFVSYHEEAHKQAFIAYNIYSDVEINWFKMSGKTSPDTEEYYKFCNDSCKSDENMIDNTGYHLQVLLFFLWVVSGMYFFMVGLREDFI
jgi:hypothetical protein